MPFRFFELNLNQIEVDQYRINPRTYKYAKLIEAGEIFPPLNVEETTKGRYKLRDGHHRYTAYQLLGTKRVKVKTNAPET